MTIRLRDVPARRDRRTFRMTAEDGFLAGGRRTGFDPHVVSWASDRDPRFEAAVIHLAQQLSRPNQPMHQPGALVFKGSVDLCAPRHQATVLLRGASPRVARR